MLRTADGKHVFVAEQGSLSRVQKGNGYGDLDSWTPNIGQRILVYKTSADGRERVTSLGAPTPGERPDQFNYLHSVAVNSLGDVYAAEVSFCECGKFQEPHAREMVSLRKWRLRGKLE